MKSKQDKPARDLGRGMAAGEVGRRRGSTIIAYLGRVG
jgi:hypothetical protein